MANSPQVESAAIATTTDTTDHHERALRDEVERFLYQEARFLDEHEYAAWERLWTDDGIYWLPANGDGHDPDSEMSIIYDNRSRIALRVRQLLTGRRYAQEPRSRLRRLVSNIEIDSTDGHEITLSSNCLVFESNARGESLWAARNDYRLQRIDGALRLAYKKVILVNNDKALFTLAFLM